MKTSCDAIDDSLGNVADKSFHFQCNAKMDPATAARVRDWRLAFQEPPWERGERESGILMRENPDASGLMRGGMQTVIGLWVFQFVASRLLRVPNTVLAVVLA